MTIRDLTNVKETARTLAYPQEDYTRTLARIFNGALTKEDLADALGATWKPIGSGPVTSTDEHFVWKNFTNEFVQYYFLIQGLLVDNSTQGSGATLHIQLGTSNGSSWSTDYSWSGMIQYSAAINVDTGAASETAIELLDGSIDGTQIGDASLEEGVLEIWLYNPMNSSFGTNVRWVWHRSNALGGIRYGWGAGHNVTQEANDSMRITTDSTTPTVFSGGTYNMYGIRSAL